MEACWSADASSRLSAGDILALLIDMDTLSAIQPASDWKDSAFTEEIWNNLRRSSYDSGVIDSLLRTVETVSNQSEEIESRGRAAGGRMKQHDILGYVARHRSPVPLESPEQSPLPSPSRTSPSFSPSRPALNIDDDISALLKGITIGRDPNTSSLPEQRQASPPTVSLEEDIKRLLEECTIGKSSATSLAQALSTPMPKVMAERRRWRSFLKEYHSRCLSSQEIIASQIPWAIATANCSRRPDREEKTTEEELLAELLDVNEKLDRVLAQYEDAHI
ncbi:hypothetical protein V5O48_001914 [Marasmius crinis-equi]|uniref:Uncharacterized protein n=1 Tax=Marasmius crinis-equi TaxID=585013 RepID=A0ABR3FX73_9AGAR